MVSSSKECWLFFWTFLLSLLCCPFMHVWSPLHCDFFNWWIACGLFDFTGQDAGTFRCSFLAWLCGCQCPEEAAPGLCSHPASIPKDEALSQRPERAPSSHASHRTGTWTPSPCRPFRVRGTVTQMRRVQSRKEESGWSAIERALPQTPRRATPCALTREHPFARAPVSQTCHSPDGLDSSNSRSQTWRLEPQASAGLAASQASLLGVWTAVFPLCLLLISSS